MVSRRLLIVNSETRSFYLRSILVGAQHDNREDYGLMGGESLCQYILREDPAALIIARGPLPFLPGNKTTVGYVSPLTHVPHYSYVGGRGFAELFNLGLDAIVFTNEHPTVTDTGLQKYTSAVAVGQREAVYLVISGRAPQLTVEWKSAADLPGGQRGSFYWLLEHELGNNRENGSLFTLGEAAQHGYRCANLGCDGIYHAGRGGAGYVFARHAAALVLRGNTYSLNAWFGAQDDDFRELRNGDIRQRLGTYCARLSRRDGGTVSKLYATGSGDAPTLPAHNAQHLGYNLADLGARKILNASRIGQTGCQWCQVNCRHWHWVNVKYATDASAAGRDMFLDDFEPTYALFAMLDLQPSDMSQKAKLRLLDEVDSHIIVPIEEMGADVIDIGVGLAALFEGLERGIIPPADVPHFLRKGPYFGNLECIAKVTQVLRAGTTAPALRAVGDGPQALAARYPALQAYIFTSGRGTLGNPGHGNALWTFLMPFSRFFSHYSGQIYKVPGQLTPDLTPKQIKTLFRNVIHEMLQREMFSCLCNALSFCAFTFVIFSEEGKGIQLDQDDVLIRTLEQYGYKLHREDLELFAEAFLAQSILLKISHGWRPPTADDLPARVYEMLSSRLQQEPPALRALMQMLIDEWKYQVASVIQKYGYAVPESLLLESGVPPRPTLSQRLDLQKRVLSKIR